MAEAGYINVAEDPFDDNVVLAGSENLFRCDNAFNLSGATVGVFITGDEGLNWYNFDLSTSGNLPNAGLEYLFIHRSLLYVALGGRGLWRRGL